MASGDACSLFACAIAAEIEIPHVLDSAHQGISAGIGLLATGEQYELVSTLMFFTGESFPVHTRATGSSLINASGQVGAIIGGLLITATLAAGSGWINAALWWGVIPILGSGLLIFAARHVDPRTVRTD